LGLLASQAWKASTLAFQAFIFIYALMFTFIYTCLNYYFKTQRFKLMVCLNKINLSKRF